jgi:hypothetical protein
MRNQFGRALTYTMLALTAMSAARTATRTAQTHFDATQFGLNDFQHCADGVHMVSDVQSEMYYAHETINRSNEELPPEYQELVFRMKEIYGINIVFPVYDEMGGINELMTYQELSYFVRGIEDFYNQLNFPIQNEVEIRMYGDGDNNTIGVHEHSYEIPGKHIISLYHFVPKDDDPIVFNFEGTDILVPIDKVHSMTSVHELIHTAHIENPELLINFCQRLGIEYRFGVGFVSSDGSVFIPDTKDPYAFRSMEMHAFMMSAALYNDTLRELLISRGFESDFKSDN